MCPRCLCMEELMASHGVLVLRLGTPSGARTMKLQTCDNFGDSALAVWELLTGTTQPEEELVPL